MERGHRQAAASAAQINVLVASTTPDTKAEVIANSVAERPDMHLVADRSLTISEVDALLNAITSQAGCALVLVGNPTDTNALAQRWLTSRPDLVVLLVDIVGDNVRIGLRDPRLESLLTALRDLVKRFGTEKSKRVAHIKFPSAAQAIDITSDPFQAVAEYPLLQACVNWVHTLLRDAVEHISEENGDVHGLSVTRQTILQALDEPYTPLQNGHEAADALEHAFDAREAYSEPLAVAARVFGLDLRQFKLMALALAPELGFRYQRCIGFLLDDMSRRVGTPGLYSHLIDAAAPAEDLLAEAGPLARWLVFERYAGRPAPTEESLKLDPFLSQWLLGVNSALASDPRVKRVLLPRWQGSALLRDAEWQVDASAKLLMEKVLAPAPAKWILLGGDDLASWRALLEFGAQTRNTTLIRIDPARLMGVDGVDVEECAIRVGRMAKLGNAPLIIDFAGLETFDKAEEIAQIRLFLATLKRAECTAAVICRDHAQVIRLAVSLTFEIHAGPALSPAGRIAAVRAAAIQADAFLTDELAENIASRYPLQIDGLEQAMQLACIRPKNFAEDNPSVARFAGACRDVLSEGLSLFAQRIEPVFKLEQVVLPKDRKDQLIEIVEHVRLAPRVLDEWKFRDQLPYGQGVTALFFGPSGTGKTMAAMGIAHQLGIQILRIDLSRVVSKYIGETEKNIDRVFSDAQRSGSAILIDEADALLGKRSEVKDAHDRYANIEVAYLLQRMEAYEGLVILTTNLRQNLDAAFVRRLRFIVEFPRPDVDAREQIWRLCLPADAHELSDIDFRRLARKVDLTGGHIRQITLRAAFMAASGHERINYSHIARATQAELAKVGMPPMEMEAAQARRVA